LNASDLVVVKQFGGAGEAARRMIPDLDIYRAAKLLVDQHGEDAPIRAAERADELLQGGDLGGAPADGREFRSSVTHALPAGYLLPIALT
jgi:hypothetical protein